MRDQLFLSLPGKVFGPSRQHWAHILFCGTLLAVTLFAGCSKETAPAEGMQSAAGLRKEPALLINYWAVWCGPCREEIPELNKLAKKYGDSLKVVAVNFDAVTGAQLQEQIEQLGIQFASTDLQATTQLGLETPSVLPTTYLLENGEVTHKLIGPQTFETLENALTSQSGAALEDSDA